MKCNTKTLLRPRPVIPSYFCQGATRLPAVACPGFKQAGGTSHEARNNACCVARLGTWDMAAPAFIKAGLLADFWRSAMLCQVVFQLLSRKMLCMQMIRRELIGGKAHHFHQQLAALLGGWYLISPCFANWVLSQDAVHWNVKVSTTCASSNYSVSSWNQRNQIINVGQYFAYIFGQFRDFDLLGIWDPHLVKNLAGASRLCLTQWDASTSHVFQTPLGEKMVRSQLQCSCVDFWNLK